MSSSIAARWLVLLIPFGAAVGGSPARAVDLGGFDTGFDTKTPEVSFDVPPTLVCSDVTTDEFLAVRPDERLMRVEAPVSLLLYHGDAGRIRDVVIEIDGAAAGLRVHDYAPRTELTSEHAEPIELKETRAVDKSLGASLGGKLAGDVTLTPTIQGGVSKSNTATETQKRVAPKRAVVVSGTLNSRRGVFYKLRPSSQSTLEGERTFSVTFAAPADWTGGQIDIRCLARGRQKWLLVEQRRVWNETQKPIELRLVSHTVAKPVEAAEATLCPEGGAQESPAAQ